MSSATGSQQWMYNSDDAIYNGVVSTSARFDDDGGANHLYKTFDADGNRQQFTIAFWMKYNEDFDGAMYSSGWSGSGGSQGGSHVGTSSDRIYVNQESNNAQDWGVVTAHTFRDFASWNHVCVAVDTTDGTAANRVKIYINSVLQTVLASASYPSQNDNIKLNNAKQRIGASDGGGSAYNHWDGLMAHFHVLDGVVADPTSFTEINKGILVPINTDGLTYGTNGYRLEFKQVGVGTAGTSTIGADTSGETNHFTSSGFVASDCALPDCPENSFCVLAGSQARGDGNITMNNAGLSFVKSGSNFSNMLCTHALFSGKYYFEMRTANSNLTQVGAQEAINDFYGDFGPNTDLGMWDSRGYYYDEGTAGGSPSSYGAGNVIGVAFDVDAGKIWFSKDGTYEHSGDPANGTNQSTGSTNDLSELGIVPAVNGEGGGNGIMNFGQDSSFSAAETATSNADANGFGTFHTAPPSGFLAICQSNIPEPDILQPNKHFKCISYSGNGSTQSITGLGFLPDWVWIKERTTTSSHALYDSSRGVLKQIEANNPDAETTASSMLTSFDADGFSVGSSGAINQSSQTYVAWCWKMAGGTTTAFTESGNNPGGTHQANTTSGTSIVTYTGTGSAGTVSHGLGKIPRLILIKNRDEADNWAVYYRSNGCTARNSSSSSDTETDYLILNTTAATADSANWWNDTAATDSVFTVATDHSVNADGEKYVAYCFADVQDYQKVGIYLGNNSTTGATVWTGFKPAYVLTKKLDGTGNWYINDIARSPGNPTSSFGDNLYADLNNAESGNGMDLISTGFKIRNADSSQNSNDGDFLYLAIAHVPFKYANAAGNGYLD